MHLAEQQHGQFRVYAAALEVPDGIGFHAGVVVRRFPLPTGGSAESPEVVEPFRDEQLDDGAVWPSAEAALAFALDVGRAALQAQQIVGALR